MPELTRKPAFGQVWRWGDPSNAFPVMLICNLGPSGGSSGEDTWMTIPVDGEELPEPSQWFLFGTKATEPDPEWERLA